MTSPADVVASRLAAAFARVGAGDDPVLRPASRPGFDYQANGALAAARRLGRSAAELAAQVLAVADLAGVCELVEPSPQGFINLKVDDALVASLLCKQACDERLGVGIEAEPKKVVVDYSHPNVAKEMHAGHLRTTVIGDALVRLLELVGHQVIKENHIGDWGTPFGMLIEHLVDLGEEKAAEELSVGDLDAFYRQARAAFDSDPVFAERARARVVALQSGDPETLRLWRLLVEQSLVYFEQVYAKLGVRLTRQDVVGESFYNDQLPVVVEELAAKGLLVDSEGALCAFPEGFVGRDGQPLPLIVRKSDGGYGYAATDLAALRDRFGRLRADLALYVVGAPQAQHLAMCFAVALQAGWLPSADRAVHVAFGSVLGSDGKMFKTRAGTSVKLIDVLDEAVERAEAVIAEKNPSLGQRERAEVARMVGIGALKYADLSTDRVKDYVFDWDRMLSFDGNTAAYLQFSRVRAVSILRKSSGGPPTPSAWVPSLVHPAERQLGLELLGFPSAISTALHSYSPHLLCNYLYRLARALTDFLEAVPVLKAPQELLASRLGLCDLGARVLAEGLGALGIEAPERM